MTAKTLERSRDRTACSASTVEAGFIWISGDRLLHLRESIRAGADATSARTFDYKAEYFELQDYQHYAAIKAAVAV